MAEGTLPPFQDLRIGYVPYSLDFSAPADRRRFCYYARRRGITFEIARPSEKYDVVFVTPRRNPIVWAQYDQPGAKVIFELVDAYLAPITSGSRRLLNLAKGIIERAPFWDYQEGLRSLCRRADAVVCASQDQKAHLEQFSKNVAVILDCHETLVRLVKTDYRSGDVFNFVWEGFGFNVAFFREISAVLANVSSRRKVALHMVTDLEFVKYRYIKCRTLDVARKIFRGEGPSVYLYQWNSDLLAPIVCSCDLALIPIPLADPLLSAKSENKLLLFWRMAMPTITSATPAYDAVMRDSGIYMACRSAREWEEMLEKYMSDEKARQESGLRARAFVSEGHSEESLLEKWDRLFVSVLSKP